VMTAYGTIAKHAPSRQLPAEIQKRRTEARGVGRGAEVSTGAPSGVAPSVPPVRTSRIEPAPMLPEQGSAPAVHRRSDDLNARLAERAKRLRLQEH
jgi:hypothetical protein